MIDRGHTLSIIRQAQLVGISRGSVYYQPKPVGRVDLELIRHIDELHLEHPFMGARMLRDQLNRKGFVIGRKHVSTLMKRMGIEALYKKPNTSKKHSGHKIYPYLLRDLSIEEANQVWALDTIYISQWLKDLLTSLLLWIGLVARWLASKVAITLESCHVVDVLQEAFTHHGRPEIVVIDQGSQFTADEFVKVVKNNDCKLSMDGRGA